MKKRLPALTAKGRRIRRLEKMRASVDAMIKQEWRSGRSSQSRSPVPRKSGRSSQSRSSGLLDAV